MMLLSNPTHWLLCDHHTIIWLKSICWDCEFIDFLILVPSSHYWFLYLQFNVMWYVVNFQVRAKSSRNDVSSDFIKVDLSYVLVEEWEEVSMLELWLCHSWNVLFILAALNLIFNREHGLQIWCLGLLRIPNRTFGSFSFIFTQSLFILSRFPSDVNSFGLTWISLNVTLGHMLSGSHRIGLSHVKGSFVNIVSFLTCKFERILTWIIVSLWCSLIVCCGRSTSTCLTLYHVSLYEIRFQRIILNINIIVHWPSAGLYWCTARSILLL